MLSSRGSIVRGVIVENLTLVFNLSKDYLSPLLECELNQAELLRQTEKIPANGYYVLLLGLFCLLFYFLVQHRLSKWFNDSFNDKIGLLGTCLVFLSSWVLALSVFSFEGGQLRWLSRVAGWLIVPLLLVLGWVAYKKFVRS